MSNHRPSPAPPPVLTQPNHFFAAPSTMSMDDYDDIECIKLRTCPFRACRGVRMCQLTVPGSMPARHAPRPPWCMGAVPIQSEAEEA